MMRWWEEQSASQRPGSGSLGVGLMLFALIAVPGLALPFVIRYAVISGATAAIRGGTVCRGVRLAQAYRLQAHPYFFKLIRQVEPT